MEDRGLDFVKPAYAGKFATEAEAAGAVDIKAQLFSEASRTGGYPADFSGGNVSYCLNLRDLFKSLSAATCLSSFWLRADDIRPCKKKLPAGRHTGRGPCPALMR